MRSFLIVLIMKDIKSSGRELVLDMRKQKDRDLFHYFIISLCEKVELSVIMLKYSFVSKAEMLIM